MATTPYYGSRPTMAGGIHRLREDAEGHVSLVPLFGPDRSPASTELYLGLEIAGYQAAINHHMKVKATRVAAGLPTFGFMSLLSYGWGAAGLNKVHAHCETLTRAHVLETGETAKMTHVGKAVMGKLPIVDLCANDSIFRSVPLDLSNASDGAIRSAFASFAVSRNPARATVIMHLPPCAKGAGACCPTGVQAHLYRYERALCVQSHSCS
jgi:hypothetical protein